VVFDGTPAEFTDERLRALYHGAQWDDKPAQVAEIADTVHTPPAMEPALA
jgi:phosphonate transport system ATP-binding protein